MSKSAVPNDVCDTCDAPYDITRDNAKLYCFLDYPRANHIEVTCPNGHEENIFVGSEGFMQVLKLCKIPVMFGINPSEEFKQVANEALDGPPEPKEVDVPHYLLRELYDQMRYYEGIN